MEAMKTVICIDTSGSTYGNDAYWAKVNSLTNEKYKIIVWNSVANEIVYRILSTSDSGGGTYPQRFLEILKTYDFKYNLLVTTDGEICDRDVDESEAILSNSNILDNIVSFKMFYIGDEDHMNMRIDNLFTSSKFKKEIFINDNVNCCVDINLDFDSVTLNDIMEGNNFKATIISLISRYPENKMELRSRVCKMSNTFLSDLADRNTSVKEFYENNDVPGCINFIRNNLNSDEKRKLQQKMSDLLNLFDRGTDIYRLSHLSNTSTIQPVNIPVDMEEPEDVEDVDCEDDFKIMCDILFIKCKHLCLTIRNTSDNIIPDEISKQISIHPFSILKYEDIIKKIVNLVEYQQMDLKSYSNLENKYISPFTRQPIKGMYIFNSENDDIDYNLIRKNNYRIISIIFGTNNKLPGNKGIWNILFLYILMKYHPRWKSEDEIFKKEINYVTENTISFLTLSPLLDPNLKEKLNVCLWYIVHVSHIIFPNSSKNILREMGDSSEYFLDFYSEVFNKVNEDLYLKNRTWLVWNHMVQQKSDMKKLKGELLAQYQNYIEVNNMLIFFSGKCEKRYKSYLNILPVEKLLGLYIILNNGSGKFDNLEQALSRSPIVKTVNDHENNSDQHVLICLYTCQPTLICPITKKYGNIVLENMI
ncbi:hypothetical protein JTB14_006130 [Gonioctena quinquepunctata]|nr:hypothetical protein JTB14_006130 [Gonioctena quinquepunctata]